MRALCAAAVGVAALPGVAAAGGPPVHLVRVGTADQPTSVIAMPFIPDAVAVTEKPGRIVLVTPGRPNRLFADLSARVKSDGYEQGLLSMAFAPSYRSARKVYVYYTAPVPGEPHGSDLVVSELRVRSGRVDAASERVVLRIPHRRDEYENGGQLAFGPDGMLWIGTGDGGGENDAYDNAQRLDPATDDAALGRDALLGKLLRIDPRPGNGCGGACTIPEDNPGFAQREVWGYGLRNPWRFWFDVHDEEAGVLYLGDVGNHAFEELEVVRPGYLPHGVNFGWPLFEGEQATAKGAGIAAGCCVAPVLALPHGEGMNAIVGGLLVGDDALPALEGRYLYASVTPGRIHAASISVRAAGQTGSEPDATAVPGGDRDTGLVVPAITSFGEDGCGRVYATSLEGAVVRLAQTGACVWAHLFTVRDWESSEWPAARIRVVAGCGFPCRVTVRGTLRVAGARPVAVQGAASLAEGVQGMVAMRLPRALVPAIRRALRAHRAATVRATITARYAGGRVERRSITTRLVN